MRSARPTNNFAPWKLVARIVGGALLAFASVARAQLDDPGFVGAVSGPAAPPAPFFAVTNYITAVGSGTWTVPTNWNSSSNFVICIGGGGAGSEGWPSDEGGAAGAGGDFAQKNNVSLTPNSTINVSVGQGGGSDIAAGADTWFNGSSIATSSCGAKGGAAANHHSVGGSAGNTNNDVGDIRFAGGAGGSAPGANGGGGGGGAGGPNGPGGAGGATSTSYTAGGGGGGNGGGASGQTPFSNIGGNGGNNFASAGGASGGDDATATSAGSGANGGGGGGGGSDGTTGGAGGNGIDLDASHGSGGGGGGSGTYTGGTPGNGGLFGGGGGGSGGDNFSVGHGAQGVIMIVYWHH